MASTAEPSNLLSLSHRDGAFIEIEETAFLISAFVETIQISTAVLFIGTEQASVPSNLKFECIESLYFEFTYGRFANQTLCHGKIVLHGSACFSANIDCSLCSLFSIISL